MLFLEEGVYASLIVEEDDSVPPKRLEVDQEVNSLWHIQHQRPRHCRQSRGLSMGCVTLSKTCLLGLNSIKS